ncbi:hypothetical protein B1987_26850 [Mycobacterium kansasii]|uniref:Anti-sigma regulatory factor n=1 Tax=Mycobacterium attenuatum TaxID=2341086 RepID=A0A498Q0U8_9MYCO|nr:sensor histidine kinase [Mycobacterium attenuatum]ORB86781.1 hypothetical protein B1987_26850 [Mycobacterium kansasii]VBA38142.1 hypothetical protein LAUMK136_02295 [Mycobacterium attenuatum]VBA57284.1 hypothetical protein LAUMK41_02382 [Mycobacterium attenuatum]
MSTRGEAGSFVHSAVLYRSEQHYLDTVTPFVARGLEQNEPVLVAAPADKLALLREALGKSSAEVSMVDMAEAGRNPARALCAMDVFAAAHPDRRVRVVGEPVWPGRGPDEYPECVQNEALTNTLFRGRDVTALCPYGAAHLSERVLADARLTHPLLWEGGTLVPSVDYAPEEAGARYNRPLARPPGAMSYVVNAHRDLVALRSFIAVCAQWLGVSPRRVYDLQLIATELATNSLEHAGKACRLALWRNLAHVVCEASDRGRLNDPLAGRRAPAHDAIRGRGLVLVNAMTDLVRIHATPTSTTIQAFLAIAPRHR